MDILHLNGTFGRLERGDLPLSPGLNLLYAPNESGKSTWTALIRTMLYGLPTRERGAMADKNRYAPWSGAPLQGRMEVAVGGQTYTLTRDTRRAAAPMGEFSCTYAGTATPVPHITAQNAGETLLGVPREVFERSAFIGQNALAVEQDAELERRIAALITTGEEDTSFTESYERLKKQLNRRRHNKTGQIPALEREIDQLSASLRELDILQDQAQQAQDSLSALEYREKSLQQECDYWQAQSLRQSYASFQEARQRADEARRALDDVAAQSVLLPEDDALTLLEGQAAALHGDLAALAEKRRAADAAQQAAEDARAALTAHPLYPAEPAELERRAADIAPGRAPSLLLPLADGLLAVICTVLAVLFRSRPTPFWIFTGMAAAGVGLTVLAVFLRRRSIRESQLLAQRARDDLSAQTAEYLPLLRQAETAAADARRTADSVADSEDSLRRRLHALLDDTRRFAPEVSDLPSLRRALTEARRLRADLSGKQQALREAELYRDTLSRTLPPQELPPLPPQPPVLHPSPEAAGEELRQVQSQLILERRQLDTLTGRIRSLDRSSDLQEQLSQKQERLAALQREYDALSLAMEALSHANTTLQNRFSPALGQRAAEIFSAITGGRYDKVLLSRDFSLSAELSGDPVGHAIQQLSQGAADQLYLAVRLAICDLVLPPETRVPLILDDALVSFDDDRLHAALDYLLQESQNRQILLFTCQNREGDYLRGRENVTFTRI